MYINCPPSGLTIPNFSVLVVPSAAGDVPKPKLAGVLSPSIGGCVPSGFVTGGGRSILGSAMDLKPSFRNGYVSAGLGGIDESLDGVLNGV